MIKKILIVDDEEGVRYSFKRFLNDPTYRITQAQNGTEALSKFNRGNFDLIILDVRLPDISGLEVLKTIKSQDPKIVVLIMTAYSATEIAIEATKLGAYDYIIKPFSIPEIKKIIDEALYCSHLMKQQVVLDPAIKTELKGDHMIGNSPMIQEVYKMIGRVAGMDVNILIRGESGTGKELVARAIYQHSHRSQQQFLAVNCAAIPETLLESELFGYEKGAFTGASHRKIGKFEQVNDGTIFLDEIGDMSLSTQAKILRVLQEGCLERLGGDQTIKVDVRIIAATNQNLEKEIEAGRFREDLYYRIKVVTITLPPLRFRKQDIAELIDYFFEKHAITFNKQGLSISPQAVEKMKNYHWPGNIRELENIIKRAIVLCKGNVVTEDLVVEEFQPVAEADVNLIRADFGGANFDELVKKFEGRLYDELIAQTEKTLIEQVLQYTGGNQVQAANILGVSRVMLRERIEKYHIKKQIIIQ